MTRAFADEELAPHAGQWDREHTYPAQAVAKLGELGMMGVGVSTDFGGSGMDTMSYAVAIEEISRGCASTGVIMSVNNSLYCSPVEQWGTEAQKHQWLTPCASGKLLGCFMLSEAGNGSDAGAASCTAVRKGDGWVLNGAKAWITNAHDAAFGVVLATTNKALKHKVRGGGEKEGGRERGMEGGRGREGRRKREREGERRGGDARGAICKREKIPPSLPPSSHK